MSVEKENLLFSYEHPHKWRYELPQEGQDELLLYDVLDMLFRERLRSDKEFAQKLWSALAFVDWIVPGTQRVTRIMDRTAARFIANMRNELATWDYIKYYENSERAVVSDEIANAMEKEGWKYRLIEECRNGKIKYKDSDDELLLERKS